jgi:hypothetical protein
MTVPLWAENRLCPAGSLKTTSQSSKRSLVSVISVDSLFISNGASMTVRSCTIRPLILSAACRTAITLAAIDKGSIGHDGVNSCKLQKVDAVGCPAELRQASPILGGHPNYGTVLGKVVIDSNEVLALVASSPIPPLLDFFSAICPRVKSAGDVDERHLPIGRSWFCI